MRISLLIVSVLVHSVAPGPLQAQAQQDSPVVMRWDELQSIISVVDPVTGTAREVYRVQRDYGRDLKVAPSGRLAALLEGTSGIDEGLRWIRLPRNRLVVITAEGRVVAEFEEDVREYVWCCGGDLIAAITGSYREGGVGFTTDRVLLLNPETKSITELDTPEYLYGVRWAAFDSSLYFMGPPLPGQSKVLRYHVPSGTVSGTPYRDIRFSPSGRYYLHSDSDGDGDWHLYERESNREISLPNRSLGGVVGWAFPHGNQDGLLLHRHLPSGGMHYTVFDVSRRTTVNQFDGHLVRGSSASHGALVVQRPDSTVLVIPRPER